MSKYGNENAAAGGRGRSTADRDRMYGGGGGFGGGSGNGGGMGGGGRTASVIGNRFGAPSASAQAAAMARNAPTNAPFAGQGGLNARRSQNMTPSYEMSLRNMYELSKMMPGPGMAIRAGLGIAGTGLGPNFSGFTGNKFGPGDYDPTNRFGTLNSQMFQPRPIQAAGAPRPAQPPAPNPTMSPLTMPAGQFSIPGPSQYGVNLPSYGYFGKPPALQRPQSLIMGGI